MSHHSRSLGDISAENDVDSEGFRGEQEQLLRYKKLAVHYPHSKTLSDIKLKSSGAIFLVGEISKQSNVTLIYDYF